jgi:hypothetical protein
MQQVTIRQEINRKLDTLPLEIQQRVLDYISILDFSGLPVGVPGKDLKAFAGTLSADDAQELTYIIEEGCETIN